MATAPIPPDEDAEVRQWTPLVHRVLRKLGGVGRLLDPDDLLAEGLVGLLRGIRTYRSDSPASRMSYYFNNVWWHLLRVLGRERKARRIIGSVRIDDLWSEEDGEGWEPVAPPDRQGEEFESRELATWLLSTLNKRERLILHARFGDELTQAEVAARHGVSCARVGQLAHRALATVRLRAARARVA